MRSKLNNKRNRSISSRLTSAFTIIELIVVISIIGILAAITVVSYGSWKQSTITTQLKSDLNGVVGAMENARTFNNTYPIDVNSLTTFTKSSGVTLSGGSSDGGKTYCVNAVNSQFPSLSYHVDSSNTVVQSGACPASVQFNLITIAGTGGAVSGSGSYASGSTPTITATPNTYYSFSSWTSDTGCSGIASHTITMDANKTCTANFVAIPITPPATPTVTANTAGVTTTWSWGAASCPSNTARYQYRYTISPSGYDSGLVATAATSVAFTTSTEGQTYTVATQAECYNAATASGMSAAGSASYFRPTPITVSGGTVSYNGAYTIRTFTSSGTLTVTGGTITGAQVLVVGGGGSGWCPSGGGAGGYLTGTQNLTGNMNVTVGGGGSGYCPGGNGGSSVFGTRTALGGGSAGDGWENGFSGGSGGGGGYVSDRSGLVTYGGAGTAGQGNAGGGNGGYTDIPYPSGGGGGAGGAGSAATANNSGGNGGAGLVSSISGTSVGYAGGGGGSLLNYTYGGGPGSATHGGGTGGGNSGTAGTGGGGGGYGGSGGSGIVIIRYLTP